MAENSELAALREEIRQLREDVETQTAINVVEGINTIETLAVLGAVGARAGGAPVARAVLRVTFWGAVAMAVTAGVGKLFGAVV